MPDFKALIDTQIANAFNNILAPGGLTEKVTFRYYVGEGDFNVEEDTYDTQWNDVVDVDVVAAKPAFADTTEHGAVFTDVKLIVPGPKITTDLNTQTDKVLRTVGGVVEEWGVRKTVGVPGRGVFIVFLMRT